MQLAFNYPYQKNIHSRYMNMPAHLQGWRWGENDDNPTNNKSMGGSYYVQKNSNDYFKVPTDKKYYRQGRNSGIPNTLSRNEWENFDRSNNGMVYFNTNKKLEYVRNDDDDMNLEGGNILTVVNKGFKYITKSDAAKILKPIIKILGDVVVDVSAEALDVAIDKIYPTASQFERKIIKQVYKKFAKTLINELSGKGIKSTLKKIKKPAKKVISTGLDIALSRPVSGLVGATLGTPATGVVASVAAPIVRKGIKDLTGLGVNKGIGYYRGGRYKKK